MNPKVEKIVHDNTERVQKKKTLFDPYSGKGAPGERVELKIDDFYIPVQWIPEKMMQESLVLAISHYGNIKDFITLFLQEDYTLENRDAVVLSLLKLRIKYDVYFWFASFVKIKAKEGDSNIPFVLTRPQIKLISEYERMRTDNLPIRLILLKARQWGGSTATQLYMAWIQMVHRAGWYSSIVAQDNSTSRKIKAMYTKMLDAYPPELLDLPAGQKLKFGSYEGSGNDYIIKQGEAIARDTVVSIGSVQTPNSIRGSDIAMCHFSEVGVWKETVEWNASNIITSVVGSIMHRPLTMIVLESTAKGTGNYFHTAWLRANEDKSDPDYSGYTPLFVAWFEIDLYQDEFETEKEKQDFAKWLFDNKTNEKRDGAPDAGVYYWYLWELGATLENIKWYITKRREYNDHSDMASEYPSDPIEAFKHSGEKTFDPYKLEQLRKNCFTPDFVGDVVADGVEGEDALRNVRFIEDRKGNLKVWEMPQKEETIKDRYLVVVDPQKGASKGADNSCILVMDRYWMMHGGGEVVVAEWNGHIDKDLLAWKSAQIASLYDNAHLVIERNTYDSEKGKAMDEAEFIIDIIYQHYDNMYIYTPMGKTVDKQTRNVGFFTNRSTKPTIINNLISVVREGGYTERCSEAVDEMTVYERKDDGNWGAMKGHKDDRVITRAIGLWVSQKMDMPREKPTLVFKQKSIRVVN